MYAYKSICVHGCANVYVCVCTPMCMHIETRQQLQLSCHPKRHLPPALRHSLSLTRKAHLLVWGCLVVSPEMPCLPLSHWDHKHVPPCLVLSLGLGNQSQVLSLPSKCFTNTAISPALLIDFSLPQTGHTRRFPEIFFPQYIVYTPK